MNTKSLVVLCGFMALPLPALATAYGSLSNFDCVNDSPSRCYGFEIELDDIHSTDITYTYDYNHYGIPNITEDKTDPVHPRTFIRYESKKNPDGTYASYTNPQDPLHPLAPTDGHAFVNPGVNLGGEHFGAGYRTPPTLVKYHWLVDDPANPGTLILGPAVNVATPVFTYVPPAVPAAPAVLQAVIIPPPPEPPEIPPPVPQFGVPVWVKVFTTVQPSGRKIQLQELVPLDEVADPGGVPPWQGDIEAPETEVEWLVFQKRPPGDPKGGGEIEGADDLPNADETVTRRYEFYEYLGPTNPEDGEATCENPADCEGAVGNFIGAQMAGFNVETPLGLIDRLQDGENLVPYVDRTLVVGGTPPYDVTIVGIGTLPDGLALDPVEGVLSGTPTAAGSFQFTVDVTDADHTTVSKIYTLRIVDVVAITTADLPPATEKEAYSFTLAAAGGIPPYNWSVDSLPQGLTLSPAGMISGTPDLGTAGSFSLSVSVTDNVFAGAFAVLNLVVNPAPIKPGDLNADGVVDRTDLGVIIAARGTLATGPDDPRDLDHDGRITVLDARKCVTLFTP